MDAPEISPADFLLIKDNPSYLVIDVREPGEMPEAKGFPFVKIPLSELQRSIPFLLQNQVILFCHAGVRSLIAAEILKEAYPNKSFFSLKGGILRLPSL
ncbi:rhodanese-like domain-containing protein [Pedobacter antarcticus]|uniref:Rhodanese domain-containing protein n=2 Tax=Pedobacter antarcticus TaxID=34086 RepID=A0A081PFJ6_9SPHI|nr:rhodanese-like domain-containing protein [Pedobacter antarcticus]KEQ29469.1 hypothetical protein N180_03680 [Pedobacter antarcticus 4BY]SDM18791.1 Rhodanese-related sulfurtransferase [Pedobacter antarcticus]SFF11666.1 Rhodanese-related sulfurtransferase [Pedobacter antarcticus]